MTLFRLTCIAVFLGAVLLTGCAKPRVAPVADRTVGAAPPPASHTVRRGETLYSIAWQYGLDYREVAVWNGIGAPYTIYPGQQLAMRKPAQRAPKPVTATPRPAPATPSQPARPPTTATAPAPKPVAKPPPPKPVVGASAGPADPGAPSTTRSAGGLEWRWPTRGRLFRTFDGNDPTRKGVDIVGDEGQAVYAASGGRVVYSGNGLVGYGNLVIIKHNNAYLSAYGYNSELLVKEGDAVGAGQLIAKMGRVDNARAMLHFEIRRQGKPIDPLRLLPKG